jgi:hypothetical protein
VIDPSVLVAAKAKPFEAALKADGSITAWGASSAGGTDTPPEFEPPHALIDPSVLIAAKALIVE